MKVKIPTSPTGTPSLFTQETLRAAIPHSISKILSIPLSFIRAKNVVFKDGPVNMNATRYTIMVPVKDVNIPLVVFMYMKDGLVVVTDGMAINERAPTIQKALQYLRSKVNDLRRMQ